MYAWPVNLPTSSAALILLVLQLEVRALEEQLTQVKAWLDNAQDQLLTTQAALQEREGECRQVTAQLEAMQSVAAAGLDSEGRGAELLQQNLELVAQLQTVTAAYEEMRAQLSTSTTSSTSLALATLGPRPVSQHEQHCCVYVAAGCFAWRPSFAGRKVCQAGRGADGSM